MTSLPHRVQGPRRVPVDRRSGPTGFVALVLSVLLGVLGGVGPAVAQEDARPLDGVELTVEVGFEAGLPPPQWAWAPVTVTVSSDRLVAGQLRVVTDTNRGRQVIEQPVEVSGGAVKRFRVLAPPGFGQLVELVVDGEVRRARAEGDAALDQGMVVGWLGEELPARRPPVVVESLDLRASWAAVDPSWLDTSSRALASLDALVVDGATLEELGETRARTLRLAVAEGLQLVVVSDGRDLDATDVLGDAAPARVVRGGTPGLDAVPAAFVDDDGEGAASATLPHGRGRVTVVAGALADVVGHVMPRADAPERFTEVGATRVLDQSRQAFEGVAASLPSALWIGAFVVLFVLVVGPVNGLVLQRLGRRELAWVTVPVVTVVFVLGAFASSRSFGDTAGVSGRLAWWFDGDGQELVAAAARTPSGGDVDIRLPGDGWAVYASGDGAPTVVRDDGDGVVATSAVDSFQRTTVLGWRQVADGPPLAVDAELEGDLLRVGVRNLSGVELTNVRLHAATLERDVDDLPAGAAVTFEVDTDGRLPTRDPWAGNEVPRDREGIPRQPDALRSLLRWENLGGQPGTVWVSASRGEQPAVAEARGRPTRSLGDIVVVGTEPAVVGTVVSPFALQRDVFTVGFGGEGWRQSPLVVEGRTTAVVRFGLPAGATDVAEIVPTLDRGMFEGISGGGFAGGFEVVCEEVEQRDADGNLLGVTEECFEVPVGGGRGEQPDCPPDAVSCEFGANGSWTFCFPDGRCEGGQGSGGGAAERPDGARDVDGRVDFEAWDVGAGEWVSLDGAFAPDAAADPAERFVSPDGVVLLRVRGEFYPLDTSGRGLGLVLDQEVAT